MIATFLALVFRILLGPAPVRPTEAQLAAEADIDDEYGVYGAHPSILDLYEWDVEGRESRIAMGVLFCLTWRIAVIKLPRWCGTTVGKSSGMRYPRQPFMRLNPYRSRTWRGRPVRWS